MVAHNWLHMRLEWDLACSWQLCGDSEILHYTGYWGGWRTARAKYFGKRTWWVLNSHCTFFFPQAYWGYLQKDQRKMLGFFSCYAKPQSQSYEIKVVITTPHSLTSVHSDIVASFNHLVGWAGTCKVRAKSRSARLPKKCLAVKKYSSPAGWISTVEKYTWGHFCTRTVDFEFFFSCVCSLSGGTKLTVIIPNF